MNYRQTWFKSIYPLLNVPVACGTLFRDQWLQSSVFFTYLAHSRDLDIDTDSHVESVPSLSRRNSPKAAVIDYLYC